MGHFTTSQMAGRGEESQQWMVLQEGLCQRGGLLGAGEQDTRMSTQPDAMKSLVTCQEER